MREVPFVRKADDLALATSHLAQILLCFASHRRTSRVLHLEPVGRAAGTVGGILALRYDAFKTHFASVREDGRAVAFDMLVEPDAGTGLGQDRCAGENITITRSVRHKRGSWWQLPKDFQKEQPEDD
jgi:hypothetical protein